MWDSIKRSAGDLVLAGWVVLAPIHSTLAMFIVLPVIDLVLACVASWKDTKSLKVRSHGIGRTIGKIFLYLSAGALAFATDKWMLPKPVAFDLIKMLVGFRELKSCLEHLDEIYGTSLLGSVIDKLVPGQQKPDQDDK